MRDPHRYHEFKLEAPFQRDLIKKFEGPGGGAKVLNVHGHGMQKSGWPDLQVYSPHLPNGLVHMELKVGRNKPSTLQREVIDELVMRGTHAYVVRASGYSMQFEHVDGSVAFHVYDWQWGTGIEIFQLTRTAIEEIQGKR